MTFGEQNDDLERNMQVRPTLLGRKYAGEMSEVELAVGNWLQTRLCWLVIT